MSMKPEKITPQKTELPVIGKMPKTDHGGSYSHHRESDSHYGGSGSTVSY